MFQSLWRCGRARCIFTKLFWRSLRIELIRAPKDKRARKALFIRVAALAYCIGALVYYYSVLSSFHDPVTAIILASIFLLILAVVGAVRFTQRREAQKQLEDDIASAPAESTALAQRFAHGLAAIMQRALGERWLLNNQVPEGHTVVVRRLQIDTLRARGVWDDMPTEVRAWMMSPDGSWPADRTAHVLSSGETLNTLLWAIGLQKSLRPVEQLLNVLSMERFVRALERPAKGIRPTWDLRIERNRAIDYFWRCQTERVYRKEVDATDEEQATAMQSWMSVLIEAPENDYLAGTSTIHELDDDPLRAASRGAAHRLVTLNHLMALLDGKEIESDFTRHVYVSLLRPLEETSAAEIENSSE